jgi:putative OPT family oligopeptide transporter
MAYQPYVPAARSPAELTVRGLLLGSALGVLFAASSVYLSVKVGLTVSASIPIAVLSIAIFRAVGRSSILENTMVQTVGSAGESLAFPIAAAIPSLLLLGYDIDWLHTFLISVLGGILGVLMMIPLRHGLIVQEHGKLAYPEGTACADVLIAGDRGGTHARTVIVGFLVGLGYKFSYLGLKLWREIVGTNLSWMAVDPVRKVPIRRGYLGGSVSMEISPELLGVGYIIGPRVAGITFAGGVLSYLVLIPAIKFFGEGLAAPLISPAGTLIREMSPDAVRNEYVLYIGAGAVATGGLISLLRSMPTIANAFRRALRTFLQSRAQGRPVVPRTEQDLPITVVLGGIALLTLVIWLAPPLQINLVSALLIVLCSFFFATVSARITGEIGSSSNPISGMVVATLLLTCLIFLALGWTSASDQFVALTTAAIVGIAASNGGTIAQDLKTAFLVGGTPWRQQLALLVGVMTSAIFIGGTLILLNRGATYIIPEPHPGLKVTALSSEVLRQQEFDLEINSPELAAAGITVDQLGEALWLHQLELVQPSAGGRQYLLRTFSTSTAQEISALSIKPDPQAQIPLGKLGSLTGPRVRSYSLGYVRGGGELPSGKYLVDSSGEIQYVVDPGIAGRISEYRGKKLTRYDAPKARLFSLIIDGVLSRKLPLDLVLLGVFIALMLELCGVSSLPFAVGVYLPISTSAPMFAGGIVRYFVDKVRGAQVSEAEFSPGVLLSSGYIAGAAITGVLLAIVALPGGGSYLRLLDVPAQLQEHLPGALARFFALVGGDESANPLWSNLWGLVFFAALAAFLLRTGIRGRNAASNDSAH